MKRQKALKEGAQAQSRGLTIDGLPDQPDLVKQHAALEPVSQTRKLSPWERGRVQTAQLLTWPEAQSGVLPSTLHARAPPIFCFSS